MIIPAFQAERCIRRAVESVLAQTVEPAEIIVIDDGSPEDLTTVLIAYGNRVSHIRKANGGAASARNLGIERSTGDLIAFLDADDFWEPDKLKRQLDVFARHPEVGIVGGQFYEASAACVTSKRLFLRDVDFDRVLAPKGEAAFYAATLVSTCVAIVRRSVLGQMRFDESLTTAEDRDLWIRLIGAAPLYLLSQPLATAVAQQGSLSRSNVGRDYANMLSVVHRHRALLGRAAERRWEARIYRQWAAGYLNERRAQAAIRPAWNRVVREPFSLQGWWIIGKSLALSVIGRWPFPLRGVVLLMACLCGCDDVPRGPRTAVDRSLPERIAVDSQPNAGQAPDRATGKVEQTEKAELGLNASFGGRRLLPDDDSWNTPIDRLPLDAKSAAYIASVGLDEHLHPDFGETAEGLSHGIPYVIVPGDQPRSVVRFDYAAESDPGMYPIPADPPIEGGANSGGDRHILMVDRDNWKLYELFAARKEGDVWRAGSGAIFDLNSTALRPAGWTSADAAGLPILPGLVRYDEVVEQKEIRHALRFTAKVTRRAYVYPARHWASSKKDPQLPPMGLRVRLKASFDESGFPENVQVILRALKKYGMFLADNGGNWFISGAPDKRWNDDELAAIKRVHGRDLEVVQCGQEIEN